MARLNAKRRRKVAMERARHALALEFNPTTQASDGHVRSSHKVHVAEQVVPAVARAYSPKPLNWEGKGQRKRTAKGHRAKPQTFELSQSEMARARYAGGVMRSISQTLPTDTSDD